MLEAKTASVAVTLAQYQSASGTVIILRHANDVFEMVLTGQMNSLCYEEVVSALDAEVQSLPSFVFAVDSWELVNYDTAFRSLWTKWLSSRRPQILDFPMAVQSQLVVMGIQVVNLAIHGLIKPFPDRAKYRAALKGLVAKSRSANARQAK